MAYGDQMASLFVSGAGQLSGDSRLQGYGDLISNLMMASSAFRDEDTINRQLQALYGTQNAALSEQMNIAREDASFAKAMRERLLGISSNQTDVATQLLNQMGYRKPVSEAQIAGDYGKLRSLYRTDVFDLMDRVNSQGYADNIVRGVGDSGAERDRRGNTVSRFQLELQKADEAAYSDAITRAGSLDDTISKSRAGVMSEYTAPFSSQYSREAGLNNNSAATGYGNAISGYNALTTNLSSAAANSSKGSGTMMQKVINKMPNQFRAIRG